MSTDTKEAAVHIRDALELVRGPGNAFPPTVSVRSATCACCGAMFIQGVGARSSALCMACERDSIIHALRSALSCLEETK